MLSIPDMALLGAAALLLFGPEQLPRVARKAGNVMREIQNTSQSFIREMERAADLQDEAAKPPPPPYEPAPYDAAAYDGKAIGDDPAAPRDGAQKPPPPPYEPAPYDAAAYDGKPIEDDPIEVEPFEPKPHDDAPYDDAPAIAMHAVEAPVPEPPVGEKLAEPRPAPGLSEPAQPPPQGDHPAHL